MTSRTSSRTSCNPRNPRLRARRPPRLLETPLRPLPPCRHRPPTFSTTTRSAITTAARYDLALSQFQDYVKYYPTTDLAGNAQFYIADMEYRAGKYEAAAADYDKVLEQFPGGNKAAAAQLKKGYSLLELGRKEAGIRELNALIQRYPHAIEATQARERLRKLGASSSRPASTHKNP